MTKPSRVGNENVPVVVPVFFIARIQPDKPTPTTAHPATMIPAVTANAFADDLQPVLDGGAHCPADTSRDRRVLRPRAA